MPKKKVLTKALTREQQLLVENNMNLARSVAYKMEALHNLTGTGLDMDDIIQAAMLALVNAAAGFDKTRSTSFSTYAYRSIKNTLIDYGKKAFKESVPVFQEGSIDELMNEVADAASCDGYHVIEGDEMMEEIARLVEKSCQEVDPKTIRQIVYLVGEGLRPREIADVLQMDAAKIHNILNKIRRMCRMRRMQLAA